MEKFEVEYYETAEGVMLAEEFILSQDVKMRAKLLRVISLAERFGHDLKMPSSRLLEDGIFELRAQQGNNISRVLYFFVVGKKIILTNGFVKKTQRTPKSEVEKAKKYRADYMSRG